jgi:hypothetical protein
MLEWPAYGLARQESPGGSCHLGRCRTSKNPNRRAPTGRRSKVLLTVRVTDIRTA